MKKIMFSLFVLGMMFTGGSAFASVDCGSDHKIWSADSSTVVSCIAKAEWDRAVSESTSAQDDNSFVRVARGQKVVTTLGYVDTCPVWFSPMSCVIKKSLFVKFL